MPSRSARAYVVLLCLAAAVVVAVSLARTTRPLDLFFFACLIYLAEVIKTPLIKGSHVRLSLTSVVAMAMLPVLGEWGAPAFLPVLLIFGHGPGLDRRVYNAAQNMVCAFVGGLVYVLLGGPVGSLSVHSFPYVLIPFTVANLANHLCNLLLLSGVLWLDTRTSLFRALSSIFLETLAASIGYGYLGLALAILWLGLGPLGPIAGMLMLAPLVVARWALSQWQAEQAAHQDTLLALAQAIETKDVYTRGHGERVSRGARLLGTRLGWTGERLEAVAQAGLLHDVGKIGVPTRVLQKDGSLTAGEFEAIKAHPLHGVALVGDIAFLEDARAGIMHHHERYDGRGYPAGLAGPEIPEFARVLAIADAFDCMTSVRSYRPARPTQEALDELERCKGDQFDPGLVDLFTAAIREHGWQPAPVIDVPDVQPERVAVAYDHDDPSRPPPVEGEP